MVKTCNTCVIDDSQSKIFSKTTISTVISLHIRWIFDVTFTLC